MGVVRKWQQAKRPRARRASELLRKLELESQQHRTGQGKQSHPVSEYLRLVRSIMKVERIAPTKKEVNCKV